MQPIRLVLPAIYAYEKVNSFLFLSEEPTLVDCGEGSMESWTALQQQLHSHHLSIQAIRKVVITHAHVDHIGAAAWLAREANAEIWVSEFVFPWAVDLEQHIRLRADMIEGIFRKGNLPKVILNGFVQAIEGFMRYWESVPLENVKVFPMNVPLNFGGKEWEIIYAPGHSITQTCFYEPISQVLMGADALLAQTPVPVIEQDTQNPSKRLKGLLQMLETYQNLANLPIKTVFPGHGEAFGNHQLLIQQQTKRIFERAEECLEWIKKGEKTVYEIAQKMYPNSLPQQLFIGFTMTLNYLDLLESQQKIQVEEKNGIWHYSYNH